MPELPEVETIRSQIALELRKDKIRALKVYTPRMVRGKIVLLRGKELLAVRRFGKLLVLDFDQELSVLIHLKMTGRLTLLEPHSPLPGHTHVTLDFSKKLAFSDMRKFGFMEIISTSQVEMLPFITSLGKEPCKDLTLYDFDKLCKNARLPIKSLLLDQHRIAGIGNIYACEALWVAKINPIKHAKDLTPAQVKTLFEAIETVLKEGLKTGGASDNSYKNLYGNKGHYQDYFKVYNRLGQACTRCKAKILRTVIAGRGTYFCPKCQGSL